MKSLGQVTRVLSACALWLVCGSTNPGITVGGLAWGSRACAAAPTASERRLILSHSPLSAISARLTGKGPARHRTRQRLTHFTKSLVRREWMHVQGGGDICAPIAG